MSLASKFIVNKWKLSLLFSFFILSGILNAEGLHDPEGYARNSSLQWEWALRALEKYPWIGTEKVLDVGCGDGKITAFISEKYTRGSVMGLDVSKEMVGFASSACQSHNLGNLLFQEGNIIALPFHGQFDLIVSFCSLHYVIEQEKGLKSIHESLLRGGKLLLIVPGKCDTSIAIASEVLCLSEKWAPFFPSFKKQRVYFTEGEYRNLLAEANLEPVYFNASHDRIRFADRKALIDWLRPLVNYTSHLPFDLREEFLQDLADRFLLKQIPTSDDSLLLESTVFECLCQKAN